MQSDLLSNNLHRYRFAYYRILGNFRGFMAIQESFLHEIWEHGAFSKKSMKVFPANTRKPAKVLHYTVQYTYSVSIAYPGNLVEFAVYIDMYLSYMPSHHLWKLSEPFGHIEGWDIFSAKLQVYFLPLVILEDHNQLSCRVQSGNNKGMYVTMQRLCRLHNPAPVCLWCLNGRKVSLSPNQV